MSKFSKTHNVVKIKPGKWRSIHGYGAAHLAYGRLLLCGYDVSLHLWRDAKYDGILEANGVPFRIEIKSTGVNNDPFEIRGAEFTFTAGGRSGRQISRNIPSREKTISTQDVDFAIGISSHDTTMFIIPVELFPILGHKIKIDYADIFKEKTKIFLGLNKIFDSLDIRNGFSEFSENELTKICSEKNIEITNNSGQSKYDHPWQTSQRIQTINVSKKNGLVLDIWHFIYSRF